LTAVLAEIELSFAMEGLDDGWFEILSGRPGFSCTAAELRN